MTSHPRQLSSIKLQGKKDIESIDLVLGDVRRPISPQGGGTFMERFDERLPFATDQLSLEVRRQKKRLFRAPETVTETVTVNFNEVQSGSVIKRGKVDVTLEVSSQSVSTDPAPSPHSLRTATPGGLKPTTEDLIEQCPRFRILVIGKTGAGKSSLINRIFGIKDAVERFSEHLFVALMKDIACRP
ncbi:hypothetical protein EDD16DRAFT_1674670 [Pisolithus croceorrhizus]|nr:hypothetical protein EDD16DRAFT_1674670 [Pisolithus croceorrhizus]